MTSELNLCLPNSIPYIVGAGFATELAERQGIRRQCTPIRFCLHCILIGWVSDGHDPTSNTEPHREVPIRRPFDVSTYLDFHVSLALRITLCFVGLMWKYMYAPTSEERRYITRRSLNTRRDARNYAHESWPLQTERHLFTAKGPSSEKTSRASLFLLIGRISIKNYLHCARTLLHMYPCGF